MAGKKKTTKKIVKKKTTKKAVKKHKLDKPRSKHSERLDGLFSLFAHQGMDFADARSYTHTNTLSNAEASNESTLNEADIVDAINMLQGKPGIKVPDVDLDGASWALALSISLIKVLQIRLTESSLMGSSTLSDTLRMGMRVPVGRHSVDRQTVVTIDSLSHHDKHKSNSEVLYKRMAIAEGMIYTQFEEIEKWIDIAKNAKENYSVTDLLEIENIEQRMAALRIFGADKLIEETQAELVSESARGNELYKIPRNLGFFDDDAYYLKYSCVSTGRIYVSGVPNWLFNPSLATVQHANQRERDSRNTGFGIWWDTASIPVEKKYLKEYFVEEWADLAMAWKFNLTLKEYQALSVDQEG